ncbi:MAG: hypothetical protein ACI4QT_01775, partial [Kiritimatiellia bacterium]
GVDPGPEEFTPKNRDKGVFAGLSGWGARPAAEGAAAAKRLAGVRSEVPEPGDSLPISCLTAMECGEG